jgi:hypothetical protein
MWREERGGERGGRRREEEGERRREEDKMKDAYKRHSGGSRSFMSLSNESTLSITLLSPMQPPLLS